jgi:membrane protease YdiL (CAAX protease family)
MIHTQSIKKYSEILIWSLAPLVYGGMTWFLAFGPGKHLPLPQALRMACVIAATSLYFYKPLTQHLATKISLLDYPLPLPRWTYLVGFTLFLLLVSSWFFSWQTAPAMSSFIFGVCASSCLEELISRTIFVKYSLSGILFVLFNVVISFTFTLMHAGFQSPALSLNTLFLVNGHFLFSFFLGIITYKTQRIELPIILHTLSNFFNHLLPVLILGYDIPGLPQLLSCVGVLIVGCVSKRDTATARERSVSIRLTF